ncbi:hypothetical protein P691DRAFT_767936 [Macrolepiota fuliginosa MF-IS2]|uniref:Uncharacterized protein n=1 Tax=Macrolepiota fuliginosa MF-IS2 TaxID=1400762 RepID=A0A9P5WWK5_9AGAR|nr:hypothetical protein P691DRAFT_767936 [Macrolepiota fuliginosa MF-IS2]
MSKALLNLQFHIIPLMWCGEIFMSDLYPSSLKSNIHADFRHRIVRRAYNPYVYLHKPGNVSWKDLYVVGCGENRVLCCKDKDYG